MLTWHDGLKAWHGATDTPAATRGPLTKEVFLV
jgi:hypothetical protein